MHDLRLDDLMFAPSNSEQAHMNALWEEVQTKANFRSSIPLQKPGDLGISFIHATYSGVYWASGLADQYSDTVIKGLLAHELGRVYLGDAAFDSPVRSREIAADEWASRRGFAKELLEAVTVVFGAEDRARRINQIILEVEVYSSCL